MNFVSTKYFNSSKNQYNTLGNIEKSERSVKLTLNCILQLQEKMSK